MFDGDLLWYKRPWPVCKPLQRVNFTACGGIFSWKRLELARIIHESVFGKHLFPNVPVEWNVTKCSFTSRVYRELSWARAEVAICGTGSLSYRDVGARWTHGTIPPEHLPAICCSGITWARGGTFVFNSPWWISQQLSAPTFGMYLCKRTGTESSCSASLHTSQEKQKIGLNLQS